MEAALGSAALGLLGATAAASHDISDRGLRPGRHPEEDDIVPELTRLVYPRERPDWDETISAMDNAPCHTARSIKVWMEDHQIKTLSRPAQSPDLNSIEKLWNVIKRKMDGHKPSNKAELLEFLCQEWHIHPTSM